MARHAAWCRYTLEFNFTARTSREEMTRKDTYFIKVWDDDRQDVCGIGECALFRGLSAEDNDGYEDKLNALCRSINAGGKIDISRYPSLVMGLETALLDLTNGGRHLIFPGEWPQGDSGIVINGLVWMGSAEEMLARIDDKISRGFRCLKMKIGGISFENEIRLLEHIRNVYGPDKLTLRLDANGAFKPEDAMDRLERLAIFDVHSIEQPIRAGQWDEMGYLCEHSPIPIALDEELIGIVDCEDKRRMLNCVKPAYIVLKPSLAGGFSGCREWIELAGEINAGWWITSALESNVGLNAIAQWTASLGADMPQGLGTGGLYTNNFDSPLRLHGDVLSYDTTARWIIPDLPWIEP